MNDAASSNGQIGAPHPPTCKILYSWPGFESLQGHSWWEEAFGFGSMNLHLRMLVPAGLGQGKGWELFSMKMSLTELYVPVKVLFQICERTRLPRKPVQNVFLIENLYSRKE